MESISRLASDIAQSSRAYHTAMQSLGLNGDLNLARQVLKEREALEKASISTITCSLLDASHLKETASRLGRLVNANSSLTAMVKQATSTERRLTSSVEESLKWRKASGLASLQHEAAALTVRRHATSMLSASLAAQSRYSQLDSLRLGSLVKAKESLAEQLESVSTKFTASYSRLFDSVSNLQNSFASLPPVATQRPPIEVYREAVLLEEITIPEEKRVEIEGEGDWFETDDQSLEEHLSRLDPGFVTMLRGAYEAMNGSMPDRKRHVATSLRELFTHVLHSLAKDQDIQRWTTDDSHYHNGRPTRRTRLLYVTRDINAEPFTEFVEADATAALLLVDALHSGTHQVSSSLSDDQLRAMVSRMESLLLFLLQLDEANS